MLLINFLERLAAVELRNLVLTGKDGLLTEGAKRDLVYSVYAAIHQVHTDLVLRIDEVVIRALPNKYVYDLFEEFSIWNETHDVEVRYILDGLPDRFKNNIVKPIRVLPADLDMVKVFNMLINKGESITDAVVKRPQAMGSIDNYYGFRFSSPTRVIAPNSFTGNGFVVEYQATLQLPDIVVALSNPASVFLNLSPAELELVAACVAAKKLGTTTMSDASQRPMTAIAVYNAAITNYRNGGGEVSINLPIDRIGERGWV